ncbi:MAG: ATP-dependent Clp protease proteolytic subunit [Parcubacteria group bacterium]|nr:ATP-dependent Clp protease proteolytic subunit [Parcubacteria group bacterium]
MKTTTQIKLEIDTAAAPVSETMEALVMPVRARTINYTAPVSRAQNDKVLREMNRLLDESPEEEIGLFVTSPGGPTGTAMSFYDMVRHVLKARVTTIGSGDVDSSGVIIFLTGETRFISARTSLLFHPAGRIFGNQRYTTQEMEAMLREDRLKDEQYASVVAGNSKGHLTTNDVLRLMRTHSVLSPTELMAYGLADAILP